MADLRESRKKAVRPWRRLTQLAVLMVLIVVPWLAGNPSNWSPSRLVQRQLPPPATFAVSGDTWSFAIGSLRFTHPVAFVESWIAAKVIYLPLLLSVLIPLALTLVVGRVFCSWMCPMGLLFELNTKANRRLRRWGLARDRKVGDYRYPVLTLCLVFGFLFAFPLISVIDPPHVLGRELMYFFTHHQLSLTGSGLLAGLLLVELLASSRLVCSSLCPSGAGLSLLGRYRCWRISMEESRCIRCHECDQACPYELAPMRLADSGAFDWTKCDNCGLCRDSCPTGAISYGWKFGVGNMPRKDNLNSGGNNGNRGSVGGSGQPTR